MSWARTFGRWTLPVAVAIWAVAALPLLAGKEKEKEKEPELDVPYVPTHDSAVEAMLKLAKVTASDYVMDLGCGDGRIVIAAAKKHKAHGLGVDLDPKRVAESKRNAAKAGVTALVEFRKADVMKTDVRRANVVTLFLLEEVNVWLRPRLFAQLRPGTRVVSNSFSMRDWRPDEKVKHDKAYSQVIYFWAIPAPVGGTWTWQEKRGGKNTAGSLWLEQDFQAVQGTVRLPGTAKATPVSKASLAGKELSVTASLAAGAKETVVVFRGTADGDVIRGTQEWRGGPNAGTRPWLAKRKTVDLVGRWQVRAPSHPGYHGTLRIKRAAGRLEATYLRDREPKKPLPLPAFYVWGSSVRFEVPVGETLPLVFSGSLRPDGSGGGNVGHEESLERKLWSAKRL